jgi:exopolyphosphatase/guanosine-5'-triphosphate,3'-diphosphate pyrophosphatase
LSTLPGPIHAVIDLGTNTILMVVGRVRGDGQVEILDDAHAIARLGQGVDAQRRIGAEAAARVCAFLRSYRERATALGAATVRAYGTSALRDAANKEEFAAQVQAETGVELVELDGVAEARLTFAGAAFGLELPERYAVLDIGGGSTELAVGRPGRLEQSASVDVGAVRVTERFFRSLPPEPAARQAAAAMVDEVLEGLFPYPATVPLVGVAGTATTLGAIDRQVARFDAEELNGHFLARERAEGLSARLLDLTLEQIRAIPQVNEQRADIIGAGSLILTRALLRFGCSGLTVSTRGIRYGLLLQELGLA